MHKRIRRIAPPITETQSVTVARLQEGKQTIANENVQVMRPLLLTITQAMEVLSLGKTKIYDLIEHEGLPVMHIGKAVRFPYKALEQWIEQRMQEIA